MTDAKWQEADNPITLLAFLREGPGDRKAWLLSCAWCRQVSHLLHDARLSHLLAVTERFADGLAVFQGADVVRADLVIAATGPDGPGFTPIKGQIVRFPGAGPLSGPVVRGEGVYVAPSALGAIAGATMEVGLSDRRIEPEAVARLRHANIVQVYDVSDHDGWPYYTMEFLEGGSLAEALAATPQPARQAAALVTTLAEAVDDLHGGQILALEAQLERLQRGFGLLGHGLHPVQPALCG